ELCAHRRFAAAQFSRNENAFDAAGREVHAAFLAPLGQMQRVGWRAGQGLRFQERHGRHQPFSVAGANRDMAESKALEGIKCRAGDEWPGIVGGDHPITRLYARGRVAARRRAHPVLQITGGQGNVAWRSRRSARRIDADELVHVCREMRADGIRLASRRPELVFLCQWQGSDIIEAADLRWAIKTRFAELPLIEAGPFQKIGYLGTVKFIVEATLVGPRQSLDLRLVHQDPPSSPAS